MLFFIGSALMQQGITPLRNFLKSKLIVITLVYVILSYILSFHEFTLHQNILASLYFFRAVLYMIFGIYIHTYIQSKKQHKISLFNLIFTFSVLLLIATTVQYIFYPNFWILKPLGWDPHMYRASAAYFDIYVAAALYGILAFFWFSKKNYLLTFLFIGALAFTFSRSAYLALSVSSIYFFITQKKVKELIICLSLFITLVLFLPKPFGEGVNLFRTASINSRIQDYQLGLKIWQEKPIFGYGYNRIRFAKEKLHLIEADDRSHSLASFHSSLLMILVTTGAVGFSLFTLLAIHFFRVYPHLRIYGIYILAMSLFDNVLLHALVVLPLIFVGVYLTQNKMKITRPLSR